jgi:MoxR-like ATPase
MAMKTDVTLSTAEYDQIPQDNHQNVKEACKMWSDLYFVMRMQPRFLLLYGPAGTFKTTKSATVDLLSRSVEQTEITQETTAAELRGYFLNGPGGYSWIDGPVTRSWRTGSRLVVNELIEAGGDTIPFLHKALDGRAIATMTLPNGEVLKPAESFQCYATMNAPPSALPEALNDRFAVKREVLFPDPRFLMSLPLKVRAAASYSIYNKERADLTLRSLTTRSWVQISEFMHQGHEMRDAIQAIVGYKNVNACVKAIEACQVKMAVQAEIASAT